jgi:hypothetical protein
MKRIIHPRCEKYWVMVPEGWANSSSRTWFASWLALGVASYVLRSKIHGHCWFQVLTLDMLMFTDLTKCWLVWCTTCSWFIQCWSVLLGTSLSSLRIGDWPSEAPISHNIFYSWLNSLINHFSRIVEAFCRLIFTIYFRGTVCCATLAISALSICSSFKPALSFLRWYSWSIQVDFCGNPNSPYAPFLLFI